MKELSIEEKAKRYDEAYKVAKNIHIFSSDLAEIKRMEEIFPELKENEDERIKEIIKSTLKSYNSGIIFGSLPLKDYVDCLAWLEKQGEQKATIEMKTQEESLGIDSNTYNKIVDECIYGEQKPAWSEEDKERFESCIKVLQTSDGYDTINAKWLKSIKDRVGCEVNCTTTKEWKPSDEQMDALQYVYRNCNPLPSDKLGWDSIRTLELMYQDLKKLMDE